MTYAISRWINEKQMADISSSDYWNDEIIQSRKIWSIPNNDFQKLEQYFLGKGLFHQLEIVIRRSGLSLINAIGASLGCGICILESFLLKKFPEIRRVYCIEFSEHRLIDIAPKVLNYYQIEKNRIELCLGSFYQIEIDDNTLDFIILCQAFHHADEPSSLLIEIKRLLKPGGTAIIIGEHYFSPIRLVDRFLKHMIKWIINYNQYRANGTFLPLWKNLFPSDPIKGDNHYSPSEYRRIFSEARFFYSHYIFRSFQNQGFLLKNIQKTMK